MQATLAFHAGDGLAEIAINEQVEIRISGGALSAGGPVLARHVDGAWHVGSQRIERIICTGRVRVEFDGQAGHQKLGPFSELSLADDVALTAQGVLARYHPADKTWYFNRYEPSADDLVLRPMPELAPSA